MALQVLTWRAQLESVDRPLTRDKRRDIEYTAFVNLPGLWLAWTTAEHLKSLAYSTGLGLR